MNQIAWNKRKATIAIALCTIIAVSSIIILQNNQTTQAALINPHPGLAGWWSFDEGSGTVAGDSSGNSNSGTINGATWVAGKYGNALSFDGISNYVSIPHNSVLNFGVVSFSLEAWIKTSDTTPSEHVVLRKDLESQSPRRLYSIIYSSGLVKFQVYDSSATPAEAIVQSSVVINDGNWHLVDGVKSGSNYYIYIDGVQRGSYTETTSHNGDNTGTVTLGRYTQVSGAYFNGQIDEARIYNRALPTSEVQAHFQNYPDFSPNLQATVPMGTTQVIVTLSWQGSASLNATIVSPSQTYTESTIPIYQKTTYSTSADGTISMLNIKRLSISLSALPSDQNWNITLTYNALSAYQISVEAQK